MKVSLNRVILYVTDVARLTDFYRDAFGLPVVEEITDEWAVLQAGRCELALHRADEAFRVSATGSSNVNSNVKLVMTVDLELSALRAELIAKGAPMGAIKSFPGVKGPLCDGSDPEGNVFQLAQSWTPDPGRASAD